MRRYSTVILFLMFMLLNTGCGGNSQPSNLPALEEMNVLLIVIDTLRADDLGCYTSDLDISPHIDDLADGGVRFEHAVAPAPWTEPSVASLLTGLMPSHHRTLQVNDSLAPEFTTLAERFKERGYRTSAVISHHLLSAKFGFAQGFDIFDDSSIVPSNRHSSERVTRVAIEQMEQMQDEPFFCFVHYFDPHYEYLHHEAFDRTSAYDGQVRDWDMRIANLRARRDEMSADDYAFLHDLYREEVAFTDQQVGALLDRLKELDLAENTLVILTADHGEEFGEHDWIGHTRYLYDTLVHVPLIFSLPGRLQPNEVATAVSLIDIVPTLEALSQAPAEADWDGRSILDLLVGGSGDKERAHFSEVAFVSPRHERKSTEIEKEAFVTAITSGGWKLIHDLDEQSWELYSLDDDPGETHNLYADDHKAARRLRPHLVEWEKGKVETWGRNFKNENQMDEKERQRLRSLGYIH